MKPVIPTVILLLLGVFVILLSFAVGEKLHDYHQYYWASSLQMGGVVAIGLALYTLALTFRAKKSKNPNDSQS